MDGWNTSFLFGWPIFRGELLVFRGCISKRKQQTVIHHHHLALKGKVGLAKQTEDFLNEEKGGPWPPRLCLGISFGLSL